MICQVLRFTRCSFTKLRLLCFKVRVLFNSFSTSPNHFQIIVVFATVVINQRETKTFAVLVLIVCSYTSWIGFLIIVVVWYCEMWKTLVWLFVSLLKIIVKKMNDFHMFVPRSLTCIYFFFYCYWNFPCESYSLFGPFWTYLLFFCYN